MPARPQLPPQQALARRLARQTPSSTPTRERHDVTTAALEVAQGVAQPDLAVPLCAAADVRRETVPAIKRLLRELFSEMLAVKQQIQDLTPK